VLGEPGIDDAEVALRLEGITVDRVFVLLGRIGAKMHQLAGIRANAGSNEHQPRQQFAARLVALRRQEFAGLVGEVEQDRIAVEHGHVAVDDRRDLGIRIDGQKFRLVLIASARVDRNRLVGETRFLQEERHFGRIRRAAKVELQHLDLASFQLFATQCIVVRTVRRSCRP
jgi:hypothetical protein